MNIQEVVAAEDGTPQRVIVWVDDDAMLLVTWNQAHTFSIWEVTCSHCGEALSVCRRNGNYPKPDPGRYQEVDVWTTDTDVTDLADAFKRAADRS